MLKIVVLGAAAGGGFPQWNSGGLGCRRARAGDPAARPATQCSLAVSADGRRWMLLDASPDLRAQINATPALWPTIGPRSSPICAVVLTSGDIDRIAGLLSLRERHPFTIWATQRVHQVLTANSVFAVLDPAVVKRRPAVLDEAFRVQTPDGEDIGLICRLFAVPGKVPLFLEEAQAKTGRENTQKEDVVGVEIASGHSHFFYVPGCASIPDTLRERLRGADLLFFDGTLWRDQEMIEAGAGIKTGERMGHISASRAISGLASADIRRKVFIHINNTNPLLLADSTERAQALALGWEVAQDGMEIEL